MRYLVRLYSAIFCVSVQYVLLQSTFRTNRFGTNRQLAVFRIFDMFQRQSLRSDRTSAAFTQRRRHFSANQSTERLPIPTCTQPLTNDRTILRAKASATMVKHSSPDSTAGVRYRSPSYFRRRSTDAAVYDANTRFSPRVWWCLRIRGCERAEIMQADRHFSSLVHGVDVEIIVDMQHAIADTWIDFA